MALHPTTRIVLGLSLLTATSGLSFFPLVTLAVLLAGLLWFKYDQSALSWIRRARYLLIVPPMIYGYVTPGNSLWPSADLWSPTWEGLAMGGMQSLRLLTALLGLKWVLRHLTTDQLTAGLLALLSPLVYLGIDVSRFATRLSLTMAYMQQLDRAKVRELLQSSSILNGPAVRIEEVTPAKVASMGLADAALLAATVMFLVLILR